MPRTLNHDDLMKIEIVKLDNGIIAGYTEGEPLQIIALSGGFEPRYENLLRASATMYRTIHANMKAFEILLQLCEDAGAEALVMSCLNIITADQQALRVATEGVEAVAADMTKGKRP